MDQFSNSLLSPLPILSAVLAGTYVFCVLKPQGLIRSALKTLPICLLALYAVWLQGPILLIGALAFSAAGDAALSREGKTFFLIGLVMFLTAHILYIWLFSTRFVGFHVLDFWSGWVGVLFAAIGIMAAVFLWKRVGELLVPVLVYIAVIVGMAWSGFASDLGTLSKIGIILFLISDFALSLEAFVIEGAAARKLTSLTVWCTYYVAQFLIAVSVLSATVFSGA